MTISTSEIQQYIGQNLYDDDGNKVGKIGAVFLDDATGRPEWVTVSTGFFGTNESFVPVADASGHSDGLSVPFGKSKIKDAPNVDVDSGHLSSDEEENLYQYYGIAYTTGSQSGGYSGDAGYETSTTERTVATGTTGTAATGTAAAAGTGYSDRTEYTERTDSDRTDFTDGDTSSRSRLGDDAMTRSEERLDVGTERVQAGKARLRKWVETEHQQVDVPVRKEKVRLESEPVTDANLGDAYSGRDITEDEHEVTITEERPVVSTEAVPVERVKLTKEVEEHTETVDGEVRKERIDFDADQDVRR